MHDRSTHDSRDADELTVFVQVAAHVARQAGYRSSALDEAAAEARDGQLRPDLLRAALGDLRWWDNSTGAAADPDGHWAIADALRALMPGAGGDGPAEGGGSVALEYPYELLGRVARHLPARDILATLVADGAPLDMSMPAAELLERIGDERR